MVISETLVGGLISRCGSNISRIRIESGAMIKVYGGKVEQKHRQIQFGGSTQQVALTKQRVDEYIYSQLIQQASAQQQVFGCGREDFSLLIRSYLALSHDHDPLWFSLKYFGE